MHGRITLSLGGSVLVLVVLFDAMRVVRPASTAVIMWGEHGRAALKGLGARAERLDDQEPARDGLIVEEPGQPVCASARSLVGT